MQEGRVDNLLPVLRHLGKSMTHLVQLLMHKQLVIYHFVPLVKFNEIFNEHYS